MDIFVNTNSPTPNIYTPQFHFRNPHMQRFIILNYHSIHLQFKFVMKIVLSFNASGLIYI